MAFKKEHEGRHEGHSGRHKDGSTKKFGKSGGSYGGKGLHKAAGLIATGTNVKSLGSKKAG